MLRVLILSLSLGIVASSLLSDVHETEDEMTFDRLSRFNQFRIFDYLGADDIAHIQRLNSEWRQVISGEYREARWLQTIRRQGWTSYQAALKWCRAVATSRGTFDWNQFSITIEKARPALTDIELSKLYVVLKVWNTVQNERRHSKPELQLALDWFESFSEGRLSQEAIELGISKLRRSEIVEIPNPHLQTIFESNERVKEIISVPVEMFPPEATFLADAPLFNGETIFEAMLERERKIEFYASMENTLTNRSEQVDLLKWCIEHSTELLYRGSMEETISYLAAANSIDFTTLLATEKKFNSQLALSSLRRLKPSNIEVLVPIFEFLREHGKVSILVEGLISLLLERSNDENALIAKTYYFIEICRLDPALPPLPLLSDPKGRFRSALMVATTFKLQSSYFLIACQKCNEKAVDIMKGNFLSPSDLENGLLLAVKGFTVSAECLGLVQRLLNRPELKHLSPSVLRTLSYSNNYELLSIVAQHCRRNMQQFHQENLANYFIDNQYWSKFIRQYIP